MEKIIPQNPKIFTTNSYLPYSKNRSVIYMNDEVAMKLYGLRQIEERKIMEKLTNNGGHPNIIEYKGVFKKETPSENELNINNLFFGLERGLGSLLEILEIEKNDSKKKYSFNIHNTLVIFLHMIQGLYYLKKLGIAHLDIKPANVMIDRNKKCAKLIDFGISQTKEKFDPSFCSGTKGFNAPELGEQKGCLKVFEDLFACDIYSFGVTIIKVLKNSGEELKELRNFANNNMVVEDPQKRSSLEEVEQFILGLFKKLISSDKVEKLELVEDDIFKNFKIPGKYQNELVFIEIEEKEVENWAKFMRKLSKVEKPLKSLDNFKEFLVYDDELKMVILRRHYVAKAEYENEFQVYQRFQGKNGEIPCVLKHFPHFAVEKTLSKTDFMSTGHFLYFEYPFCPLEAFISVKANFKVSEIDSILSALSNSLLFLHLEAFINHGSLDKSRCIWLCRTDYPNLFRVKLSNFQSSKVIGSNESLEKSKKTNLYNEGSDQNMENETVYSRKINKVEASEARAKDLFDMGVYFEKICSKKSELADEGNKILIEQWEYITSLMLKSDPVERLAVIPYLEKYCIGKRQDIFLDKETREEILDKILKEDEDYFKSKLKTSEKITLSKIIAYQDIHIASEYQVIEENLPDEEMYWRKEEEDTETFFNRLLQESEEPKNYEYFLIQNKYLRYIIKECPGIHHNILLSTLSRLVANYIEQGFINEADQIAKKIEDKFSGCESEITLETKLNVYRGLVNYAFRRNNKPMQYKYSKEFKILAKKLTGLEEINAWRGNVLFHCFEIKVFHKKTEKAFKKHNELAGKMINFLKDLNNRKLFCKSEDSWNFKIANLYHKIIWILGRYFHEKKKDNIKMTSKEIQKGEEVIDGMRAYYNILFDYLEDDRFHNHWNLEGIFYNVIENEDSLKKNIEIYPRVIQASRNFLGGNSKVGYALRNYSDALISFYYVSEKKKQYGLLKEAKKALEEELKVGSVFNKLSLTTVHILQGSQERIDRIEYELTLETTDPEKASKTRGEFWARALPKK